MLLQQAAALSARLYSPRPADIFKPTCRASGLARDAPDEKKLLRFSSFVPCSGNDRLIFAEDSPRIMENNYIITTMGILRGISKIN